MAFHLDDFLPYRLAVAAQQGRGDLDGPVQHTGFAAVERVDAVDLREPPLDSEVGQDR